MAASLSFWQRAWKQPQQLWLRRASFQIHLWCGVIVALYIIAIGISGSILVFHDELTSRPHIDSVAYDPANCTPQRLIAAIHAATSAHPHTAVSIASCPIEANHFYAINLHSEQPSDNAPSLIVYVHPETGKVVGDLNEQGTWLQFVENFHVALLLKKNGAQWNGVGAAILLAITVTGLILWWPGIRNWSRGLKVDFRRTWKRINWDLHSAIGIWTIFFVGIWAVTGIYFAWEAPFEKAINAVSRITTARYPEEYLNRLAANLSAPSSKPLDLQRVLANATTESPGAQLEGVFYGTGPKAMFTVYMAHDHLGDYTKTDFIYYDQQSGAHLLTWRRGQNKTIGDWILWLFVPLHFGTSWGLPGKIAWCALGLTLPALAITGLIMYWNRWLRKALASSRKR